MDESQSLFGSRPTTYCPFVIAVMAQCFLLHMRFLPKAVDSYIEREKRMENVGRISTAY